VVLEVSLVSVAVGSGVVVDVDVGGGVLVEVVPTVGWSVVSASVVPVDVAVPVFGSVVIVVLGAVEVGEVSVPVAWDGSPQAARLVTKVEARHAKAMRWARWAMGLSYAADPTRSASPVATRAGDRVEISLMRRSALIVTMLCGCARAHGSAVVMPPRQPPASRAAISERGDVEIGLGAVMAAVAGVLVGVGSYEAHRAVRTRSFCSHPDAGGHPEYSTHCMGPLGGDPYVAAVVSSSLSFAFAVPIAVASGFLLRRGIVTRRAWKAGRPIDKMSFRPWSNGQTNIGLTFGLAF